MGQALLVVDVQVAYIPLIWRGDELVARIAKLITAARAQGVPVIAVQQTDPAGTAMAAGTQAWQPSPGLGLSPSDQRLEKPATDSFYNTNLAEILAETNVDTIILTGVGTDYCVDATARSALSHDLNVILVSDSHAPRADGDPDAGLTPEQVIAHHNAVLKHAIHPGGQLHVVPAAEVFPA